MNQYRGVNFTNVKTQNRSAVLKLLKNQGAMSRKDIAAKIGLTPASVTYICTELLEEGIIREIGEKEEEKRAGRKKILVDINYQYRNILCIGIEADETSVAVTDLAGNTLAETVLPTDTDENPEKFLKGLADISKKMMWEASVSKDRILAAGVSIPGRQDRDKGISIHAYGIWNEQVPAADILSRELGIPVVIENNVKAHAEAELLFGYGIEQSNVVILKWGPGVGSSIIIGNEIYQGTNGMAAEVGHMIIKKNGKLCRCGKHGCLETEVSEKALTQEVRDFVDRAHKAGQEISVIDNWIAQGNRFSHKAVAAWANLPEQGLQNLLDAQIDILARVASNLSGMLDPSRIIVYGSLADVPTFFERFLKAYKEYDLNVSDDFIYRSQLAERIAHAEPLAIVWNDYIFS